MLSMVEQQVPPPMSWGADPAFSWTFGAMDESPRTFIRQSAATGDRRALATHLPPSVPKCLLHSWESH